MRMCRANETFQLYGASEVARAFQISSEIACGNDSHPGFTTNPYAPGARLADVLRTPLGREPAQGAGISCFQRDVVVLVTGEDGAH